MNTSAHVTYAGHIDNFVNHALAFTHPARTEAYPCDDLQGFSTTDGFMVTFHAGKNAISNGAGIFIGDYFVGLADSHLSDSAMPFIKY